MLNLQIIYNLLLLNDWSNEMMLSVAIATIGLVCMIYNYKNFLITMFAIEIMYLGITLSFLIIGFEMNDVYGQIYSLVYLIIAAAESALGLGILIVLYRFGKTINYVDYQRLRG